VSLCADCAGVVAQYVQENCAGVPSGRQIIIVGNSHGFPGKTEIAAGADAGRVGGQIFIWGIYLIAILYVVATKVKI
jgi:hypothetical protein